MKNSFKVDETYRKPLIQGICNGAEKLYKLESERNQIIKLCAKEHGKILGLSNFYKQQLPEQLASILESFDQNASILAATSYLESKGWRVFPQADEPLPVA